MVRITIRVWVIAICSSIFKIIYHDLHCWLGIIHLELKTTDAFLHILLVLLYSVDEAKCEKRTLTQGLFWGLRSLYLSIKLLIYKCALILAILYCSILMFEFYTTYGIVLSKSLKSLFFFQIFFMSLMYRIQQTGSYGKVFTEVP